MVVLRQGTNNWTCIADWPVSPGNDPVCNDPVWTTWNDAYAAGTVPEITTPGIAYMLAGGSDPSNTDPMAMAPAPGEAWITTPSHIMLLVPGGFDAKQFTTDPCFGTAVHHVGWYALRASDGAGGGNAGDRPAPALSCQRRPDKEA